MNGIVTQKSDRATLNCQIQIKSLQFFLTCIVNLILMHSTAVTVIKNANARGLALGGGGEEGGMGTAGID